MLLAECARGEPKVSESSPLDCSWSLWQYESVIAAGSSGWSLRSCS